MSIRVLLADDQPLMRSGLRMSLDAEPDIEVVAEAADGQQAIDLARNIAPDVVLMDIRMPVLDGLEATRRLRGGGRPDVARVVILTTFEEDAYIFEAMRAGASGFLLKTVAASDLVNAVRVVAAGDSLLSPTVTRKLIAEFARRSPRAGWDSRLDQLTERELEVLRLVARGLSNAEIASMLFVSQATVKTHVGHVLDKLDLRDRVQAVVLAYESGLTGAGEA